MSKKKRLRLLSEHDRRVLLRLAERLEQAAQTQASTEAQGPAARNSRP